MEILIEQIVKPHSSHLMSSVKPVIIYIQSGGLLSIMFNRFLSNFTHNICSRVYRLNYMVVGFRKWPNSKWLKSFAWKLLRRLSISYLWVMTQPTMIYGENVFPNNYQFACGHKFLVRLASGDHFTNRFRLGCCVGLFFRIPELQRIL